MTARARVVPFRGFRVCWEEAKTARLLRGTACRKRAALSPCKPFSKLPLPSCCQRTAPDYPVGMSEKQFLGHNILRIHVG